MKKFLFFVAGLVFFTGQVFAQDSDSTNVKDPNEQIIVNKKYDDQGNLIQFDSTYVHQWSYSSSDSSGQFTPPDDFMAGGDLQDMERFFQEFMEGHHMPHPGSSPFDDEFFNHFKDGMPDSAMQQQFLAHRDSSFFNFPGDSLNHFPQGLMPDMEDLMQEIQEHFNSFPDNFGSMQPRFKSKEQENEWKKLMEKQQKEIEEFQKKWNEQ
jgi:hypothetical protein